MKFTAHKKGFSYHPSTESDQEKSTKVKEGDSVIIETWKDRNIKFHRKFFALINLGFQNQERYSDIEAFRKVVIISAGYFEELILIGGEIAIQPQSISFKSMDETKFNEVFKSCSQVIMKFCQITEQQLNDNLNLFM